MAKVSFALASNDQLLLFSEEFTQILSSWPAKWVWSRVVEQGAYKALLLGSLAVRDPSVQGNMLFSAIGVKELALAI